jgi:hypothetical protein
MAEVGLQDLAPATKVGKPQMADCSRSDNGIVSASADVRREWLGIVVLALAVVLKLNV